MMRFEVCGVDASHDPDPGVEAGGGVIIAGTPCGAAGLKIPSDTVDRRPDIVASGAASKGARDTAQEPELAVVHQDFVATASGPWRTSRYAGPGNAVRRGPNIVQSTGGRLSTHHPELAGKRHCLVQDTVAPSR